MRLGIKYATGCVHESDIEKPMRDGRISNSLAGTSPYLNIQNTYETLAMDRASEL
jgi:hypothetical protein